MLLCIDTGNTNTVFSVWDGTKFLTTLRTATEHQRTADEYFVWFRTLLEHHGLNGAGGIRITDVIISSTVPRVVFNLRVLCDRYFGTRPYVVGKPDCGLPVLHPAGATCSAASRTVAGDRPPARITRYPSSTRRRAASQSSRNRPRRRRSRHQWRSRHRRRSRCCWCAYCR